MPGREIHVVIVWSSAAAWNDAIVDDLAQRFRIRDVFRVTWTQGRFAGNLSRLYGDTLPPGSEKERESGTGPFLLVVIEDARARYALRKVSRRFARVNVDVFAARRRYRRLTGGGFKVHATLNEAEAEKDLFLISGRRVREYAETSEAWNGEATELARDLLGTDGWRDEDELVHAIEVCGGCDATSGLGDPRAPLVLVAGDPWWAERIAQGRPDPVPGAGVTIGGIVRRVEIRAASQ
jgi:hypothetical protein